MKDKNNVEVIIAGERYRLSGYESTEYIHRVAAYINSKYDEVEAGNLHINNDMKKVLIELNITDELFKVTQELEQLKQDCEETDKMLFNLKHQLASIKEKLDKETEKNLELTKRIENLKKEDR